MSKQSAVDKAVSQIIQDAAAHGMDVAAWTATMRAAEAMGITADEYLEAQKHAKADAEDAPPAEPPTAPGSGDYTPEELAELEAAQAADVDHDPALDNKAAFEGQPVPPGDPMHDPNEVSQAEIDRINRELAQAAQQDKDDGNYFGDTSPEELKKAREGGGGNKPKLAPGTYPCILSALELRKTPRTGDRLTELKFYVDSHEYSAVYFPDVVISREIMLNHFGAIWPQITDPRIFGRPEFIQNVRGTKCLVVSKQSKDGKYINYSFRQPEGESQT